MSWEKRKQLCIDLLKQSIEVMQEQDQIREVLEMYLQDTIEKFQEEEFLEQSEWQKHMDTIHYLMNVAEFCSDSMQKWFQENNPSPPVYMTKEQAKQKLLESYFEALEQGDTYISSLTIDEWIENNHIVIVEQDFFSSSSE